jgi:hypothetical protein
MNEIKTIITNIMCPFCKDIFKKKIYLVKLADCMLFCPVCNLKVKFDLENLKVEAGNEYAVLGIGFGDIYDIEYIDYDFCKKCKQKRIFYIATFNRAVCLNCYSDA